jgi:hypothetical protein
MVFITVPFIRKNTQRNSSWPRDSTLHSKAEYICANLSIGTSVFPCSRAADHTFRELHADRLVVAQSGRALFADLTGDVIRSGSFGSVKELVRDIDAYLTSRNAAPKPYRWKAKGAAILAKINRARAALDNAKAVV